MCQLGLLMTRNNADFHGYTFDHSSSDDGTAVVAYHPEERNPVGMLYLEPNYGDGGLVRDVNVLDAHRRKGVAAGMWNYAKNNGLNPIHSKNQTALGKQWAKAVGE